MDLSVALVHEIQVPSCMTEAQSLVSVCRKALLDSCGMCSVVCPAVDVKNKSYSVVS